MGESKLVSGARIEANYKGIGRWYPGVIKTVNSDGTVDVDYDDGESEAGVSADMIRVFGEIASTTGLQVGAKVEVNYKGSGQWYPGAISKINDDATFNIAYDDGDAESNVGVNMIRILGKSNLPKEASARKLDTASRQQTFKLSGRVVGSRVEVNYRGNGTWYPGKISRERSDGKFDIAYDDGDSEMEVDNSNIRSLEAAAHPPPPASAAAGGFTVGTRVEARYKAGSKWYSGSVASFDGVAYNINYDDGESESGLAAEFVRLLGAAVVSQEPAVVSPNAQFSVGMRVECSYRGSGNYYPGRVMRDLGDNTYDIDYDDGEREPGATEAMLRAFPGTARLSAEPAPSAAVSAVAPVVVASAATDTGAASASGFKVGDKVEANYRNRGIFFPGVIRQARPSGGFEIAYDDGETEADVRPDLIRFKPKPVDTGLRLAVGTAVEGNCRGSGLWFPGKIMKDHQNGAFDIEYDDGEIELEVLAANVKVLETFVAPSNPVTVPGLTVGAKVEANYRNSGKWYPGVIKLDRGNATFDVDYDDGEKETKMPAAQLRLPIPPLTNEEIAALRELLASGVAGKGPLGALQQSFGSGSQLNEQMVSPRGVKKALVTSKELELEAMSHEIAALQDKNKVIMDQLKSLNEEMAVMRQREAEMAILMKEMRK